LLLFAHIRCLLLALPLLPDARQIEF
jgi:hypothetical protein